MTNSKVILDKLFTYVENPNMVSGVSIITKLPKKRNRILEIPKTLYHSLKRLFPHQPIENIIYSLFKTKEDERYYGSLLFKEEEGWKREVSIPDVGYIDGFNYMLNLIVELKFIDGWKSALGQILAYSIAYPKMRKEIWLLISSTPKISRQRKIESICCSFDVHVKWIKI